jgi:low temperature requirement protein LtrA
MATETAGAETETERRRLRAAMREGERVMPLELFFDLVFVLAITQCTQLMSNDPTWSGLAQGLLVLAVLWWAWVGYAWLTSVIDPEDDAVRVVIFAAMAAMLLVALCVPEAFDDRALTFALAYGGVRVAHIGLFVIASRDDPEFRRSVVGLAISTAIGVALLAFASTLDGIAQGAIWALAITLDMGGPILIPPAGWRLQPVHFAERHGLIVLIALGESIVAIGVGVGANVSFGQGVAAVIGVGLAAALWWWYFDIVAIISARRFAAAEPGYVQNTMARDGYSYLHFPMVAGIVLVALGMKKTLAHVDHELDPEIAFALLGGVAIFLLALVAFRYRHIHTWNVRRIVLAVLLFALIPVATVVPATASVAGVTALAWIVIAFETRTYGDGRWRLRHDESYLPNPSA